MIRDSSYPDILKDRSAALVNPVNCVGVMGKGLALQFKKAYPKNYELYKEACDSGFIVPGKLIVFETGQFFPPHYIINFPTKVDWRNSSKLEYIHAGLWALEELVTELELKSIAIPPLGCGLGGLNWSDVKPLIVNTFEKFHDVHVTIYNPPRSLK